MKSVYLVVFGLSFLLITLLIGACAGVSPQGESAQGKVFFDRISVDTVAVNDGGSEVKQVNPSFGGIGFEWDIYDAVGVHWSESVYSWLKGRADMFKPAKVRLKFDIDKLTVYNTNFYPGDHTDKPIFNWAPASNLSAKNLFDILDYCQLRNIDVAIGLFGARGSGPANSAVPSEGHIKYARYLVEMLDYLVNNREYNCIKYIIPYNEPNFISMNGKRRTDGSAYPDNDEGRFEMWRDCMTNLASELNKKEFKTPITIAATDVSTTSVTHTGSGNNSTWLAAAMNYKANIGIWQTHNYNRYNNITEGRLTSVMSNYKNYVAANAGPDAEYWIYEAGFLDGKNESRSERDYDTNSNLNGDNGEYEAYTYAVNMADYILQCALGGVDGVILWSLDKMMHHNFSQGGSRTGARDWGLVDSETSASRPWFYVMSALSRAMQPGFKVYRKEAETALGYRSVYTTDGSRVYAAAVNNRWDTGVWLETDREFKFPCSSTSDKVYIYYIGPDNLIKLDKSGKLQPAEIRKANFNDGFTLQIPQGALAIVSQSPLF